MRHNVLYLVVVTTIMLSSCGGIRLRDLTAPRPVPKDSCVVVGFLGGRGSWDDETREVRRTALRLRDSGKRVYVETFENRRRDIAETYVLEALDENGDGIVDSKEAAASRLVIYGLSFGGAAVVKFSRQLAIRDIAVELTVQVDSVGRGDGRIPPNVHHALNLYQDNGWLIAGEQPIRAEDEMLTQVLGNLRFDYDEPPGSEISLAGVPWWRLIFRVAHSRMSRDPRVWSLVERAIEATCAGEELEEIG